MESEVHLYDLPGPDDSICFRHNGQYVRIILCKILFCEAEGNYTNVYLKGDPNLVITCKRLIFFRWKLRKYNVFQLCHKSYIINLDEVNSICNESKKKILKISEYSIPVARRKWNELLPLLSIKGLKEAEK